MSPKKQRRLAFAIALLLGGAGGAVLIVLALGENTQFFFSPSDMTAHPPSPQQTVRIGGLVEEGTFVKGEGLEVRFSVTDRARSIPVRYRGALPDLFREGQGVVALGDRGRDGVFVAREVLAKPTLMLVGQPTRGVDIGTIESIHTQLLALRDAGVAILLVSVELEEVRALADRILVMSGGRITGELQIGEFDATRIGLLMGGMHHE